MKVTIKHSLSRSKACREKSAEVIVPVSYTHLDVYKRQGVERDKVVQYVEKKGVQTRMLFAGNLTKHPCFDEMRAAGQGYRIVGSLDNTDRIMADTFWVGVYPGMTDEMIDYMARTIKEAVGCA